MSEPNKGELTRRDFLKLLGLGFAGAGALSLGLGGDSDLIKNNTKEVQSGEILFSNKNIELKASPINGIVDIHEKQTGQLVNNLVFLVSWKDEEDNIHYNNSEIQNNPIVITKKTNNELVYSFKNNETNPTEQPASKLELGVQFINSSNDEIKIHTRIQKNPDSLNEIRIGIGCFFGINQGVNEATISQKPEELTIHPDPNSNTGLNKLGKFDEFSNSTGFSLSSAYNNMPDLILSFDSQTAHQIGTVDIESRNLPYKNTHQHLLEKYINQTGTNNWIEAGILYSQTDNNNPTFILSLSKNN